jgi:hypothetical protein
MRQDPGIDMNVILKWIIDAWGYDDKICIKLAV